MSNSLYYSLVGLLGGSAPQAAWSWRAAAGRPPASGAGAVVLPPVMGLGRQPHRKTPMTELLTVAWYTLGGLAAAARALSAADEIDRVAWRGPPRSASVGP